MSCSSGFSSSKVFIGFDDAKMHAMAYAWKIKKYGVELFLIIVTVVLYKTLHECQMNTDFINRVR